MEITAWQAGYARTSMTMNVECIDDRSCLVSSTPSAAKRDLVNESTHDFLPSVMPAEIRISEEKL